MKSKITIDLDHDNQPVIKINYQHSDDVRDKMVKRFLESFTEDITVAAFRYEAHGGDESTSVLRPLDKSDFKPL